MVFKTGSYFSPKTNAPDRQIISKNRKSINEIINSPQFKINYITYSVFLLCLSSKMSLRLMATCPKNLSRPTRDLCITMRKRMYFSGFPCISKPGSSKEASSFQTGSRVFSATDVEYFSLPSWIIVYVSLVPLLPFGLRSIFESQVQTP